MDDILQFDEKWMVSLLWKGLKGIFKDSHDKIVQKVFMKVKDTKDSFE